MIEQASDVAANRGDKHIGIEDILFLLRKDKVKLKRLLRFLEVRDLKNVIKGTLGGADNVNTKTDINVVSMQDKQTLDTRAMSRSRQTCFDFLSVIDQTGELVALFDDHEVDAVKHERMLRAEMQSQGLDTEQYLEFCQARQTSFCRRLKVQRFRDWLQLNLNPEIVLSAAAIEIFSYLAYETVAQVVDLSLLVKQDMRAQHGDALSRTRPALCVSYTELYAGSVYGKSEVTATGSVSQSPPYDGCNPSQMPSSVVAPGMQIAAPVTQGKINKKKRMKSGPPTSVETSWDCTIQPSDVREAMRRYFTDISPFSSQTLGLPSHSYPYSLAQVGSPVLGSPHRGRIQSRSASVF